MTRAAAETGVPLNVLYSVGLTETGAAGELGPYDMNVDGRDGPFGRRCAEAMARFAAAKGAGARFIDVGCMQINVHFHGAGFASLAEMFDPARNVDYAATLPQGPQGRDGRLDAGGRALQRRARQTRKPSGPMSARSSATWSRAASAVDRSARALCL